MDARFETEFDDVEELLIGVDIELDDLETLLMVLLARPVGIDEACEDDAASTSLEVTISGNKSATRSTYEFPTSVIQLVRSCAQSARELGAYNANDVGLAEEVPDFLKMAGPAVVTRLQQALGQVRLFSMIEDDESGGR